MFKYNSGIVLIAFLSILVFSCANSDEKESDSSNQVTQKKIVQSDAIKVIEQNSSKIDSNVYEESIFIFCLKNGKNLRAYFCNDWTLVYHEDNRCDGSTDGQLLNLNNSQIDSVIKLTVKNDGDGWACDKKEPSTFQLDFNLKKMLKNWDRFEIPNHTRQDSVSVYIVGAGASDYLKLYLDKNGLIQKLEYRSEDPG